MSWFIQLEGSKEGVKRALENEKLQEGNPDVETYNFAKKTIAELIDLGSSTQNGVRVRAAGHGSELTVLEVEGRAYSL